MYVSRRTELRNKVSFKIDHSILRHWTITVIRKNCVFHQSHRWIYILTRLRSVKNFSYRNEKSLNLSSQFRRKRDKSRSNIPIIFFNTDIFIYFFYKTRESNIGNIFYACDIYGCIFKISTESRKASEDARVHKRYLLFSFLSSSSTCIFDLPFLCMFTVVYIISLALSLMFLMIQIVFHLRSRVSVYLQDVVALQIVQRFTKCAKMIYTRRLDPWEKRKI